jgi:hypothetical protein
LQQHCKFGKHTGKTHVSPLLTVGRRSRSSYITAGEYQYRSVFEIPTESLRSIRKGMATAFWLTSRQVYLGITIYPRSDIFLYIASIIFVLQVSGGCTLLYTLRTRLTHSKFALQGHGSFFALTSFLLKA